MRSHSVRRATWIAAASFLIAGAGYAGEARDAVLVSGEKLDSVLSATGETKLVAVAAIAGSKLSVLCKATRGSRVSPFLTLLDPTGRTVPLQDGGRVSTKKAQAKKILVGRTGIYRVSVSTPPGSGGSFQLVAKSKAPKRYKFSGTLTPQTTSLDFPFDVLPDSSIRVTAKSKGKLRFTPTVQIVSPAGVTVVSTAPAKGATKVPPTVLEEFGSHVLRIGGGVGDFAVSVKVKPPSSKTRTPRFEDVEALPEITELVHRSADNAGVRLVGLEGFAFTRQHSISLSNPALFAVASSRLTNVGETTASAELDLSETPAGTYDVDIGTATGKTVRLPWTFEIRNKQPAVASFEPQDLPWSQTSDLRVRGAGFDHDVEFTVTRTADGAPVTVRSVQRFDHALADVELGIPEFQTGPHDVRVRDPSGGERLHVAAFDVLGLSQQPADVLTSSSAVDASFYFPRDAAFDDRDGNVLVSVQAGDGKVSFALYDTANRDVLATFVPAAGVDRYSPRVSWSARDRTWALCWVEVPNSTTQRAVVSVHTADLGTELSQTVVTTFDEVTAVNAAPNEDTGGFVVVWEQFRAGQGSDLRTQPVASSGTVDFALQRTVAHSELGWIITPNIAWAGDDRFVVIYKGTSADNFFWAIRRVVLWGDGSVRRAVEISHSEANWFDIFQPELAVNPHDGSLVVIFTYVESDGVNHPGGFRLTGDSASAGTLFDLDGGEGLPSGFVDSLVWNEERDEFVIALSVATQVTTNVVVRRLSPDGFLKRAPVLQQYEGVWGILYAGAAPGTLGMFRRADGTIGDRYVPTDMPARIHGGSMR